MQWYFILLIFFGSLIIFIFILLFVAGYAVSKTAFNRIKGINDKVNTSIVLLDEEFYKNEKIREELTIKSFDNLNLKGYLYKNNSSKYVIFAHGYHGKFYEQSYIASYFYKKGYNVLLIVQRGHDDSEGKYVTMGYNEKYDILSWAKEIVNMDKNASIALFGWSMGGASVLMASGINDLENIKVVVSDCAYTSIYDEIYFLSYTKVIKNKKILSKVVCEFAYFYSLIFKKINIKHPSALELVKESNLPTLFIHGKPDDFVSTNFVYKLYEACNSKKKDLKIFKASAHCFSLIENSEEYISLVYNFINNEIE